MIGMKLMGKFAQRNYFVRGFRLKEGMLLLTCFIVIAIKHKQNILCKNVLMSF